MNERIKELISEATIKREEYLPGNDGHPTPTVYFDKEKFAELIVRECARVYWNIDDGELHDQYVEALKKHFGVER